MLLLVFLALSDPQQAPNQPKACFGPDSQVVKVTGTLSRRTYVVSRVEERTGFRDSTVRALFLRPLPGFCATSPDRFALLTDVQSIRVLADSATVRSLSRRLGERLTLEGALVAMPRGDHSAPIALSLRLGTPPWR